MSQLQNPSARKNALLGCLSPAPPRLPYWASHRQCGSDRLRLSSQDAPKSSFFRCGGVLQLTQMFIPAISLSCCFSNGMSLNALFAPHPGVPLGGSR